MDGETLKTLGNVLLWGGLFFVMMRYGCGSHMTRRRAGHTGGGCCGGGSTGHGDQPAGTDKDPVCGMTVDASRAAAAAPHDGRTYYFCSTACRDKFEQAPASYAADAQPAAR